jgi:tetratricopeptide (TPR) repeat protein
LDGNAADASLHCEAVCRAARLLTAQGRRDEAVAQIDELLTRQPLCVAALLLRGDLWDLRREPAAALQAYAQASVAAPESAAAWNGQARQLRALERRADAFAAAQRARELLSQGDNFVQTGSVYLTLVWCLRDEHRFREALALAEEGLRKSSDAVLAEWATQIEEEWANAEQDRC